MKARFAAAVLILAADAATAASMRTTTINFSQAVKLPDGNILPTGLYDVEISTRG